MEPEARRTPGSPSPGDAKICPFCAETIKAAARVCRYCGRDLSADTPVSPSSEAAHRSPLDHAVSKYISLGYIVVTYTPPLATLKKPKRFDWATFFLLLGLLYILYYFVQPEKIVTLRLLPDGSVQESGYTRRRLAQETASRKSLMKTLIIVTIVLGAATVLCVVLMALPGITPH